MLMDLFFVISSFLISYSFTNELSKFGFLQSWKNFFLKRSFRIFPPLYVLVGFTIVLMSLTIQAAKQGINLGIMADGIPAMQSRLNNWWVDAFYISNYFTDRLHIHGWSLSMEEQFYIAMPLFIFLYAKYLKTKFGKILTLVLLLFLPILIRTYYYFYIPIENSEDYLYKVFHPIHTHFDSFLAGILLMEIIKIDKQTLAKYINPTKFFIVFLLTLALYICSFGFTYEENRFYFVVFRITNFTMLAFLITYGTIQGYFRYISKLLSNVLIVCFGKLSYGIYLIHMYVSAVVMIKIFDYVNFDNNGIYEIFMASIFSLLVSFLIALISYYIIEKPFIKVREWTQPKFNVTTQSFYFIESHPTEKKIVCFLITFLSFIPAYFMKLFLKSEFIPKNEVSSFIQIGLFLIPLLLNIYTLTKFRKLLITIWLEKKITKTNF